MVNRLSHYGCYYRLSWAHCILPRFPSRNGKGSQGYRVESRPSPARRAHARYSGFLQKGKLSDRASLFLERGRALRSRLFDLKWGLRIEQDLPKNPNLNRISHTPPAAAGAHATRAAELTQAKSRISDSKRARSVQQRLVEHRRGSYLIFNHHTIFCNRFSPLFQSANPHRRRHHSFNSCGFSACGALPEAFALIFVGGLLQSFLPHTLHQ